MPNQVTIIIVEPQMAENIGAIARCMKNFALTKLKIVAPRCTWPDCKAYSMSAGADDVLDNAQVYDNFNDAVKDLTYLYASTARRRYMNKAYTISKDLTKDVQTHNEQGHRIGIVFGREANGLSNHEVNLCDQILVIDNNENFSSLNIAQAVGIIAYELFKIRSRPDLENIQDLCDKVDLDNFLQHLIGQLEPCGFFQVASKREHMIQNIKNIYTRIPNLSRSEVKTLRGILVALGRE